jgi:hypothetical protein
MYIFINSLFIVLNIIFIYYKQNKLLKEILFIIILYILVILSGLRYGYVDYFSYINIYNLTPEISDFFNTELLGNIHSEYGYLFINSIFKTLNLNYTFLFVFISTLTLSLSIGSIKKYSPYFMLSILLYFAHHFVHRDMILIRTGLASAIILFSYRYIISKKYKTFILCILLASLIHKGALMVFLAFLMYLIGFKRKILFIILIISIFIAYYGGIANILMGYLKSIGYLPDSIDVYYTYKSQEYNKPLGLFNPTTIKGIFLIIFSMYYYSTLDYMHKYFKFIFYSYYSSVIWLLIFSDFSIFAGRIATFLSLGEVILFPITILVFSKDSRLLPYVLIMLLAILTFYLNIQGSAGTLEHLIFGHLV